jgi:hypothetical protein
MLTSLKNCELSFESSGGSSDISALWKSTALVTIHVIRPISSILGFIVASQRYYSLNFSLDFDQDIQSKQIKHHTYKVEMPVITEADGKGGKSSIAKPSIDLH